jgi:hypothetical protein
MTQTVVFQGVYYSFFNYSWGSTVCQAHSLFCGTGIWTQGFTLVRQVLYHLNHTSSPTWHILSVKATAAQEKTSSLKESIF